MYRINDPTDVFTKSGFESLLETLKVALERTQGLSQVPRA